MNIHKNDVGAAVRILEEQKGRNLLPEDGTFHCREIFYDSPCPFPLDSIVKSMCGSGRISLYFHIPTCPYICTFCTYSKFRGDERMADGYADLCLMEVSSFLREVSFERPQVSSVYIGGGTPLMLSEKKRQDFMEGIASAYDLSRCTEITIESTPDIISDKQLEGIRALGITRLSLGVQSTNDAVLRAVGRRHTRRQALDAIFSAKFAEVSCVNADLMYGLPGQTVDDVLSSTTDVIDAGADSVTFYRTRFARGREKNILLKRLDQDRDAFMSFEDATYACCEAKQFLVSRGFCEGPMGWFTRQGVPVVYQDRWEEGVPLIGFGLGSYSYGLSWQYENYGQSKPSSPMKQDVDTYRILVMQGKIPVEKIRLYTLDEQARKFAKFKLRTGTLDILQLQRMFGTTGGVEHTLAPFEETLITRLGTELCLTEVGKAFCEEIIHIIKV